MMRREVMPLTVFPACCLRSRVHGPQPMKISGIMRSRGRKTLKQGGFPVSMSTTSEKNIISGRGSARITQRQPNGS